MKHQGPAGLHGFLLIEMTVATFILVMVIGASVAGFAFMLRNDRLVSTRIELDMEARLLVERMRYDLWHTSQEQILLYPPGASNYTAISFPVIYGNDAIDLNEEGGIAWDNTVIYHFRTGEVFEVRRTTTAYTTDKDARQDELADVAESGGSADGETRVLVRNLVEWELNTTAAQIDFYARSNSSAIVSLGSIRLEPGPQEITFTAVGKNKASLGNTRYMGIDYLNVTPSGLPLEGEWLPVLASSGSSVSDQNMATNELWSGNARLWFPATADNHSFTLGFTNDVWEERNFLSDGDKKTALDRFATTNAGVNTYAVRLEGKGDAWLASDQTRDSSADTETVSVNTSYRAVLRGSNLGEANDGGWIRNDGTNVWAVFNAVSAVISNVFIAESAANTGGNVYDITGASSNIPFTGGGSATVSGVVTSRFINYVINKAKTYVIGYNVAAGGTARAWEQGDGPDSAYSWSTNSSSWVDSDVVAFSGLRTGHAPTGSYLSAVIDTKMSNPTYERFDWFEVIPSGYAVAPSLSFSIRAGDFPVLTNRPWVAAMKGSAPAIAGRYVQVQAVMRPGVNATTGDTGTPILDDFVLVWEGPSRFVDLEGKFAVGPSMGIYEVTVNGSPLLQGIKVKIAVKKDVVMGIGEPREVKASAFAEIVPRNR